MARAGRHQSRMVRAEAPDVVGDGGPGMEAA